MDAEIFWELWFLILGMIFFSILNDGIRHRGLTRVYTIQQWIQRWFFEAGQIHPRTSSLSMSNSSRLQSRWNGALDMSLTMRCIYGEVCIRTYMGVSLHGGTPKTPQNDHFLVGKPWKTHGCWVPPFQETPICTYYLFTSHINHIRICMDLLSTSCGMTIETK